MYLSFFIELSTVLTIAIRAVLAYSSAMEDYTVGNYHDTELKKVVLCIGRLLKYHRTPVWRRCNETWIKKVRYMERPRLRRELIFLLSQCLPRQIARLYSKCFQRHRVALLIAGEYVTRTGLRQIAILQPLVDAYDEAVAFDNLLAEISSSSSSSVASFRSRANSREVEAPIGFDDNDGDDDDDDDVEEIASEDDSDHDDEDGDDDVEILEEDDSDCIVVGGGNDDSDHPPVEVLYRSVRGRCSTDGASTSAAANAEEEERVVPDSTVPLLFDSDEVQQQQQREEEGEINSRASTTLAVDRDDDEQSSHSLTASDINFITTNFHCTSQFEFAREVMVDLDVNREQNNEQVPTTSGEHQRSSPSLTASDLEFLEGNWDSSPEIGFHGRVAVQAGAGIDGNYHEPTSRDEE